MKHFFQFTLILLIGEIISFFIFKFINWKLQNKWDLKFSRAVLKGIPQAIIAFGAIKIATRQQPLRADSPFSNVSRQA